jgi:hypothetical protein
MKNIFVEGKMTFEESSDLIIRFFQHGCDQISVDIQPDKTIIKAAKIKEDNEPKN